MLISLAQASKKFGYVSRDIFNKKVKQFLAERNRPLVVIGGYSFVEDSDLDGFAKNPGKGRPVTTGAGLRHRKKRKKNETRS